MKKNEMMICGKKCILYLNEDTEYILIQPVDENDISVLDSEVKHIEENADRNFSLVAFKIEDWNSELTPWEMSLLRGKGNFGDGAAGTLEFIKNDLILAVSEYINIENKEIKYILGGYSLAGLFSLWSGYQTDIFEGIAAVSPSVWYKGWIEYVAAGKPLSEKIYLSLGDTEEKTKHQILSKIGDNIRKQHEILEKSENVKTVLEWNEGNHFQNPDIRTAKGFLWVMNK
ncbi:esterase [Leptotrichia sp. oral taxon 212]|jgi:hypothetical protein|uniref:esterase n=1 Tax=Leptotrichia sp. oral taxon 212 TaxID=712357 RepID=UPI0006A95A77|nr:esterase [Leptotrichia sp. oral taxon 212]ALA94935.1 esterase [Leptotrichia sp. oral taxon 212]